MSCTLRLACVNILNACTDRGDICVSANASVGSINLSSLDVGDDIV